MKSRLLSAAFALLAFASLAAALAEGNLIVDTEAALATVSVAFALTASVVGGSTGWRRHAGELLLLPTALALTLIGEPTLREMAVTVLLTLSALTTGILNLPNTRTDRRSLCAAAIAFSLMAANGAVLFGHPYWRVLLAFVPMIAAAGAARAARLEAVLLVALTTLLPIASYPGLVLLPILLSAAALMWPVRLGPTAHRVFPAVVSVAILFAALGRWGVASPLLALPEASWPVVFIAALALVAIPRIPAGVLGVGWFLATILLGPAEPPPTVGQVVQLTAAAPTVSLPIAGGGEYHVETSLAHASSVRDGALVATARSGALSYPLRAGRDAAEWAFEREDVHGLVEHSLPADPLWRPSGSGSGAFWAVAGRLRTHDLPAGEVTFERAAGLPGQVIVTVTAGPAAPTPPRNWGLREFLLAAALVVAVLQLAGRTWMAGTAIVPWLLLTSGSVLARVPVVPLQVLLEKHSVDLALAALVAAWLPAARRWLACGRFFLAAAALLVPVALATPHLTPPMYGDEPYHLAILDALSRGASLPEAVRAGAPPGLAPIHGPLLAVLLLPGHALAGRSGALAMLAIGAAALVSLVARRASSFGVPAKRVSMVAGLIVVTAPLATYASQIWPEVPGALAVAGGLILAANPSGVRWISLATAALAGAVETRLALVCFPIAITAAWPKKSQVRSSLRATVLVGAAAAGSLGAAWLFLGHALGAPRSLASLIPHDARGAALAAGGLFFDPAGGLAIAAPLVLVALLGVPRLWQTRAHGERAAVVGLVLTVLALLHSAEWYGGGSPPARYLVCGLPVVWLAGAMLLRRTPPAMGAVPLLMPPALLSAWALISRPQLSVNPGNGRFWLTDVLAERFRADTRHLVPSFLLPSSSTWLFPLAVVLIVVGLTAIARRRPVWIRVIGQRAAVVWLAAMALATVHLVTRHDRIVQIEDPQVEHLGGRPEPPAGTWSTYLHPGGWRLADGDTVVVPVRMEAPSMPLLVGWLEGPARQGCAVEAHWHGGVVKTIPLSGEGVGSVSLPAPPFAGRSSLRLTLRAPAEGTAVFDRLVVAP